MEHRVLWVHGIGDHKTGYSSAWQDNFGRYLALPSSAYIEVLWETVLEGGGAATRGEPGASPALALTPEEQAAEIEVRAELETILLARQSAAQAAAPPVDTRSGGDLAVIEWSEMMGADAETRGILDWFRQPNEYLGDFVKYLVSRRIRNAIKEKLKEQLRPLTGQGFQVSIIAHSWGTVAAYDSLHDLSTEVPGLEVRSLVTLGSPLWMVRRLLDERSGVKPPNLTQWQNIHARGDVIGSWLKPAYRTDSEFEVPSIGNNAHASYFNRENQAVQEQLVAPFILG